MLVSKATFRDKVLRYQTYGLKGIKTSSKNDQYSSVFKDFIVLEYINNQVPIKKLALKYNIPSARAVKNWINKYIKSKENRDYFPKPEVYIMKGRKTTHEERIEIVQDFLKNGMTYKESAEKHRVSYNNIYV